MGDRPTAAGKDTVHVLREQHALKLGVAPEPACHDWHSGGGSMQVEIIARIRRSCAKVTARGCGSCGSTRPRHVGCSENALKQPQYGARYG